MPLMRIFLSLSIYWNIVSADQCGNSGWSLGIWIDSSVADHDGHRPQAKLSYRDVNGDERMYPTDGYVDLDNTAGNVDCNDFDGGWDYFDDFNSITDPWDVIYLMASGTDGVVIGGIQYIGPGGQVTTAESGSLQYDSSADMCATGTSFWLDQNAQETKCYYVAIRLCDSGPIVYRVGSETDTINNCDPTPAPSESPTVCTKDEAQTFDWDDLTQSGTDMPQYTGFSMTINESDLSLNIEVTVPFILEASADYRAPNKDWGVTYFLDFEDLDAHSVSPNAPGTCSNREGSAFEQLSYDTLWVENRIGIVPDVQYPENGDKWQITAFNCETVTYAGHFTWSDLRGCTDYDGAKEYTSVSEGTDALTLKGTFYINLVSPYWYTSGKNYDYYRIYQLLSQPFVISVSKSVYVIGSTDVNVMTMSIIAVYKDEQDLDYNMVLLTETAEYLQLLTPDLLSNTDFSQNSAQYTLVMQTEAETGTDCLNNKAFLCSQLWKVTATDTQCNGDNGDGTSGNGGISFSGNYQIKFDTQCRASADVAHCGEWLDAHPKYKNEVGNADYTGVLLQSQLTFVDQICETKEFTVQLFSEMSFYEDADFTAAVAANPQFLYQVGESMVYARVDIHFPTATDEILNSKLENVWLCTFPPGSDPEQPNDANIADYKQNAVGGMGCFSATRDGFVTNDGVIDEGFFFHVYSAQSVPILQTEEFAVIADPSEAGLNNQLFFQFRVPNEIQRDTLYIHAQIAIDLVELQPRRRVLLQASNAPPITNRFTHLGNEIGITHDNDYKPQPPIQEPNNYEPYAPQSPLPNTEPFTIALTSAWVMIIGGIFSAVLAVNIVFLCYVNCCKGRNGRGRVSFDRNRRSGYDSVKEIDSEEFDDSEANLINVKQ